GELIGEMAFIMGSTRTADVQVMREGELLLLSERTLQHLIEKMPVIASKLLYNLSRILCERLATTTRNLTEATAIVPAAQPTEAKVRV
ncbi:MAG: hypothetical protein KGR26_02060, partial [Cyanobacteria bacterium REEB65]|nr:hypothetical protein [Cyanobacteria bacterium REEB65]